MGKIHHFNQVIWAIDPIVLDKEFQEIAGKVLKSLAHSHSFMVKPVSVILEDQLPYIMGSKYTLNDVRNQLESSISDWLTRQNIINLEPLTLLLEKSFSVKSAVQLFLNFSAQVKPDVIVATTHAKKRSSYNELGTFSETLFLSSEIPLFLIPPRTTIPEKYQDIFFPTDLSEASLQNLSSIEELAKELKARVTIFHKVLQFHRDIVEFPNTADARANYLAMMHNQNQEKLNTATQFLRTHGVDCQGIMERIDSDYVSSSITTRANLMANSLIAMASRTDSSPSTLPGSITRQVIRNSTRPIWVL